jgi:carboxyl-terminal processing protease
MRRTILSTVPAALVAGACSAPPGGVGSAEGSSAAARSDAAQRVPGASSTTAASRFTSGAGIQREGGTGSSAAFHHGSAAAPLGAGDSASRALQLATFDAAWRIILDTHFDPDHLLPPPARADPGAQPRSAAGERSSIDWHAIRSELRPRAEAAESTEDLRLVVDEMLARLGQSHFALVSAESMRPSGSVSSPTSAAAPAGAMKPVERQSPPTRRVPAVDSVADRGTLGMHIRVVQNQALVTAVEPDLPAALLGIRPGWVLVAVDGQTVQDVLAQARQGGVGSVGAVGSAEPVGSWQGSMLAQAVEDLIDGPPGVTRQLVLRDRRDEEQQVHAALANALGEEVQLGDLPALRACFSVRSASDDELRQAGGAAATVGIVSFNVWLLPIVRPFHEAIDRYRRADGLVIDLRGNRGGIGYFATAIAGHLVQERSSLGSLRTREGRTEFDVLPRRVTAEGVIAEPFAGPIAVLVDECTASTSEIFAGGLQALGRVRVFGQPTAGATLPARTTRLPNGDTLLHATADYLLPDGTRLEGRGVIPDEPIPLRRGDLLEERDAVLLGALRWIARHESTALHASRGPAHDRAGAASPISLWRKSCCLQPSPLPHDCVAAARRRAAGIRLRGGSLPCGSGLGFVDAALSPQAAWPEAGLTPH